MKEIAICEIVSLSVGFPGGAVVKNLPTNTGDLGQSLGLQDPLEQEMVTHCTILPWKIPWRKEPDCYSPWGHEELDMTEHIRPTIGLTELFEKYTKIKQEKHNLVYHQKANTVGNL